MFFIHWNLCLAISDNFMQFLDILEIWGHFWPQTQNCRRLVLWLLKMTARGAEFRWKWFQKSFWRRWGQFGQFWVHCRAISRPFGANLRPQNKNCGILVICHSKQPHSPYSSPQHSEWDFAKLYQQDNKGSFTACLFKKWPLQKSNKQMINTSYIALGT